MGCQVSLSYLSTPTFFRVNSGKLVEAIAPIIVIIFVLAFMLFAKRRITNKRLSSKKTQDVLKHHGFSSFAELESEIDSLINRRLHLGKKKQEFAAVVGKMSKESKQQAREILYPTVDDVADELKDRKILLQKLRKDILNGNI